MATNLSQPEVDQWLHEHIPHRVRVMLASTADLAQLFPNDQPTWPSAIVKRCWTDAVWEGRLSALRWLCEFVGISRDKNGNPCRPSKRHPEDIDIADLPHGRHITLSSNDATVVASAWKACTQGSVHPTHGSAHPPIDDSERTAAFDIIKAHLSQTLYANTPDWINRWVLQPPPK